MRSCSITPQVRNTAGEIVDSKLFQEILPLVNGDREKAETLYLQTRTPSFYEWFGNWALDKDKKNGTVKPKEVFNFIDQAEYRMNELNTKYGPVARLNQSNASGRLEFQVLVSFPDNVSKEVDENGEPRIVTETRFADSVSYLFVNSKEEKKSLFNENTYGQQPNRYHQIQSPNKERDAILDKRIEEFLTKNNISLEVLDTIVDEQGNKVEANAVADILYRTIKVVNGEARIDTLPEEASHFLVEMLGEEHPLYQSMFNEIESYQAYKDVVAEYSDLYKGNVKKLKKEAMAKVIAQSIVGQFEEEAKAPRVNRWWNKVIDFIKSKIKAMKVWQLEDIVISSDPFSEAAQKIMNGEYLIPTWNLDEQAREQYFQLKEPQQIIDNIKNRWKLFIKPGEDRYTVIKDGQEQPVKKRVSDRVKEDAKKMNFKERTDFQKSLDDIKAKYGTKGHADIANIIERAVANREGKLGPARVALSTESIYNVLETHFTKFINQFPKDTRFMVEQVIYDEKSDEAGTIDLLAIHADGTVDIYDWKFIDFGKKTEVPFWKIKALNIQLPRYKEILAKQYGITKFGKVRIVPISAIYDKDTLSRIEIGDLNVSVIPENKSFLQPVPAFEEMTGDENLDRLLQSLLQEKAKYEGSKAPGSSTPEERSEFNIRKRRNLDRIQKAIREIQVQHDIAEYIAIGMDTLTRIQQGDIPNMDEREIQDLINTMGFYGKEMISLVRDIAKDQTKPYHEDISRLVANSQLFEEDLKSELVRRVVESHGRETLEEQKEQGTWGRNFRAISQQTDPIIKAFWKLVKGSKAKVEADVETLTKEIEAKVSALKESQPDKNGVGIFDFMLNNDKGELKIASKYSSDFYKELDKNRHLLKEGTKEEKAKALAWIKSKTEFNKTQYDENLKAFTRQMTAVYKFDRRSNEVIAARIKEYVQKYGDNENGYSNPKNFNIKFKEDASLYSEEYKGILATPAKKEFYDLWMKNSKEFQDYIGRDLGGRFVWNVPKDLADSIMENGLGAFGGIKSITEHFLAKSNESLGMIDSRTGKPSLKIPAYYTERNMVQNEKGEWVVDSKNQSRDLGKILGIVSGMAYNHKYMSEIETNAKSLEMLLKDRQTVMTNSNGETIVNKLTSKVQKITGSMNTLEQFQDYMNYYIYGMRSKDGDFLFGKDNKYSAMAVYNTVAKYFVGKALAANPVSIVANAVGGDLNARIVGAKNLFYNNEEYANASMNLIPRALVGNRKIGALIEYFDLVDRSNVMKKGNDLSVGFLTRNLTYDKLFFGQKGGDYLIRNSVLLAMMQSHTIKDGKIVKKKEGDTSLLDTIEVNNEKLDLSKVDLQELENFRNKALAVTDNILGNNSRDDIRLAQLTILGRVLLMFRSWMPRTIDERYGELRYNEELGQHELGRYRTFWNQLMNKHFLPLLLETIRGFGVMGYGGKFGHTTIEHAKKLYAEHMYKNPNDSITEQEYIDLHLANLRASMLEVYLTMAILGMIWGVAPDDDETLEQGSIRKYAHSQLQRLQSELMFFYSPGEFNKLIRSPIPITRLFTDIYLLAKSSVYEGVEEITGDEGLTKKNEQRKYWFKVVPVLSGFETILSFADEDYDKTETFGVSSKNR